MSSPSGTKSAKYRTPHTRCYWCFVYSSGYFSGRFGRASKHIARIKVNFSTFGKYQPPIFHVDRCCDTGFGNWIGYVNTVWVKKNPLRFSDIFPKRLGIFNQFFTHLLYDPLYTILQIFIQLFPSMTTTRRIFTLHYDFNLYVCLLSKWRHDWRRHAISDMLIANIKLFIL